MAKTKEAEKETTPPVHKASLGPLQVGAWEYKYQTKDGNTRLGHNISLTRNYQDKDGNWQKSVIRLNDRDLGSAVALLQNIQQYVLQAKAA